MRRWWWIGDHGSLNRRDDTERAAAVADAAARASSRNAALVVGSTGLVGAALLDILPSPSTPAGPWKVYAVARSPLPPWSPSPSEGAAASSDASHVVHLHFDLADAVAVAEALEPLTDITHVFYAAFWSPCHGATTEDDEAREANCDMLRNVLAAVVPNNPALVHICLQTGRKRFVDPFEPLTGIPSAIVEVRPYSEDLPRLEYPHLEDVLLNELAAPAVTASISWSVHLPAATVFGFSPRSAARNAVASLCVYAAICRKEGGALRWPGSLFAWEGFSDASDAELVAEQMLWAALEPRGKNEVFNCTNGDVYKWKNLWPMLASHFEVEWSGYDGEDRRFKLEEAMAGKEAVWAEIVREKGLVETRLDDVTTWWFVDALINADKEHLENMNKCKERGFFGFRNTVRSFSTLIEKMKADRIVP